MKKDFLAAEIEVDVLKEQSMAHHAQSLVLGRTFLFFAAIFAAAAGYDQHSLLLYSLAIALAALFLCLLQLHSRLRRQQLLLQGHMAVLKDYTARFDGSWRHFPDDGTAFLREDTPQASDLSLFGPDSFYQYLSAARTQAGRQRLADALQPAPPDFAELHARQQAAAEFMERSRLAFDLQGIARLLPEGHDVRPLLAEIAQETTTPTPVFLGLIRLLPLLTLGSLLAAALDFLSWLPGALLVLLQLTLTLPLVTRHNAALKPLQHFSRELAVYAQLLARLEELDFHSPRLRALAERLQAGGGASLALQKLARISDFAEMRYNFFFFLLANALLLWDFHCRALFQRWQARTAGALPDWLAVWSECELLMSLAVVGQTRENCCFPELLTESAPRLQARDLQHLLLDEAQGVPNDIEVRSETRIITGSNMSGKTTFLRTLASSVVLAWAGAPVCAAQFGLTRLHVFTSIRVTDDITKGLSTFYAELLRIKSMVEFAKKKTPMLICIDEIFKGTNSADRIIGARAAIERLTGPQNITLVSTHDFELCDLLSPNDTPVTNYHFAETYDAEGHIRFDFRLQPGRCQTTNAKYLLRLAGILDE